MTTRLIFPRTMSAAIALRKKSGGGGSGPSGYVGTPHSFLNRMLADTGGNAEIYHVTNLNASGAGSFVDAITGGSSGLTRIVVFDVSGVLTIPWQKTLNVVRSNLFVAGETCPDPGDGTGRGFIFRGAAIRCHGSNQVWRHITVEPTRGYWHDNTLGGGNNDQEGIYWLGKHTSGTHRGFMCVNCSFHGSTDEAVACKNAENPSSQLIGGSGYADCNIPAALNDQAYRVDRDGENPGSVPYETGHNYGPMVGYGTFGMLFLGNVIATAVRRGPQYAGSTSGNVEYNHVFGHGKPDGGGGAVPFIVDARTGDGTDEFSPFTDCKTAYINNSIEAGHFSDPWKLNGDIFVPAADSSYRALHVRWDVYHEGNRHFSHFADEPNFADNFDGYNKNAPQPDPVEEWTDLAPDDYRTILSEPYHPRTVRTGWSVMDVPSLVRTYAGAWPQARHALDTRFVNLVEAKSYWAYGRVEPYTFITTRTGAAPTLPGDPWTVEGNGLTKLENRLNELHVEAGGYPDYAAAEWYDRAWPA